MIQNQKFYIPFFIVIRLFSHVSLHSSVNNDKNNETSQKEFEKQLNETSQKKFEKQLNETSQKKFEKQLINYKKESEEKHSKFLENKKITTKVINFLKRKWNGKEPNYQSNPIRTTKLKKVKKSKKFIIHTLDEFRKKDGDFSFFRPYQANSSDIPFSKFLNDFLFVISFILISYMLFRIIIFAFSFVCAYIFELSKIFKAKKRKRAKPQEVL